MEILRQAARLLGRKNKQFETLTEINTQGFKVRIWREAKSLPEAESFDHDAFMAKMHEVCDTLDRKEWKSRLGELPRVACVAIVDKSGNGVSYYQDWH